MSTNNPNPPNIDQRLEALTHSVELLATMHQDSEQRLAKIESLIERVITVQEALGAIV